jgi:hypothetical protein
MKKKIKDAAVAQKKGLGFIQQQMKKIIKQGNPEPQPFFYDSAFDYGGKDGVQPLLYIGEVSTEWKKYAKANKASTTFVAGTCLIQDKQLKLVASIGKGAKPVVLKVVNKVLLKPFAVAVFVESIENPTAIVEEKSSSEQAPETTTSFDIKAFQRRADEVAKVSKQAKETLGSVVNTLTAPLQDIKSTIITDDLISKAKEALSAIQQFDLPTLINELQQWLDNTKEAAKEQGAGDVIKNMNQLKGDLEKLAPQLPPIQKNAAKLEKVQNPLESDVLPVSDEPLDDLFNSMTQLASSSPLSTISDKVSKAFEA